MGINGKHLTEVGRNMFPVQMWTQESALFALAMRLVLISFAFFSRSFFSRFSFSSGVSSVSDSEPEHVSFFFFLSLPSFPFFDLSFLSLFLLFFLPFFLSSFLDFFFLSYRDCFMKTGRCATNYLNYFIMLGAGSYDHASSEDM